MSERPEAPQDAKVVGSDTPPPSKHEPTPDRKRTVERIIEVAMAILLGVVAVATTWSGYQAARWSGVQSADYSQASALRVTSTRDATLGGQAALYDLNLFDQWLDAYSHGDTALANIYERRFRAEFRPAFTAWLATNPFTNPQAPPGPLYMPQYKVSLTVEADALEQRAAQIFQQGQDANQTSDNYVLNTVLLATVLLLVAIAERFDWLAIKIGMLAVAFVIMLLAIFNLVLFPIN